MPDSAGNGKLQISGDSHRPEQEGEHSRDNERRTGMAFAPGFQPMKGRECCDISEKNLPNNQSGRLKRDETGDATQ
jgi:hypothetical protein